MRKERHFLDLYALLFHNLRKSICLSGLLAQRPAFLWAAGSEVDGTRSTLTRVYRDRTRKPTWETKISSECLSEFYPVSHLQQTREKTKKRTNKSSSISMMVFLSRECDQQFYLLFCLLFLFYYFSDSEIGTHVLCPTQSPMFWYWFKVCS